ncbi:hypothetical protein BJ875DRAFT_442246 [Amylocarpus encephaloides]|uniref:Uncharacterized protein n=1 Tax=Amylocarpus encephaloides TaxID=45428 RepID=A0A9P8C4B7_9HELO|nr:hypothetical protein BJ875DRAFT_442246 [Amylocarpus encephaloides]
MYAFACVLVELVLWQPLMKVHSKYTTQDLEEQLINAKEANAVVFVPSMQDLLDQREAMEFFASHGDDKIIEIVTSCSTIKKAEADNEGLLNEQIKVVESLAWYRI